MKRQLTAMKGNKSGRWSLIIKIDPLREVIMKDS
jgi:hypothetical protein